MAPDIFVKTILPSGIEVSVIDGIGKHYFSAMSWAKGDPFLLLKSLMIQLVLVDEKHVTEDYIDNLSMRDVIILTNVMQSMLTDTNK